MTFSSLFMTGVAALALASGSQDAAVETLDTAQDWNVISRSSATVYMVDVSRIRKADGITTAYLARVPATGEATDLSHSVGQVDFRCSANQSRPGEEVIYGADGQEEDRINDGYDFDRIPSGSLDAFVKGVVCDDERSVARFPSIADFIAKGRPSS